MLFQKIAIYIIRQMTNKNNIYSTTLTTTHLWVVTKGIFTPFNTNRWRFVIFFRVKNILFDLTGFTTKPHSNNHKLNLFKATCIWLTTEPTSLPMKLLVRGHIFFPSIKPQSRNKRFWYCRIYRPIVLVNLFFRSCLVLILLNL